jgi:hypothetical protein
MSAADMYCLADMKALAELSVECATLPETSTEALAAASQALNKSLRSLTLYITKRLQPEALQAFPGLMTTLKELQFISEVISTEQDRAFVAAVSSLVNLEDLHLSPINNWTTEMQQEALAALARLTRLELEGRSLAQPLALLPAADTLRVLKVPWQDITGDVADAVLSSAVLQRVEACSLQPGDAWRGKVAQRCAIQELKLSSDSDLSDDDLRNMPKLPALKGLVLGETGMLQHYEGRYLHLARLLQRHAGMLEHIIVATLEQLNEALPDLPVCKVLQLESGAVGAVTHAAGAVWHAHAGAGGAEAARIRSILSG